MRIDSRLPAKAFDVLPSRDRASEVRAGELQAQAAQPLAQNPALQAFRGESGFDGAGSVQSLKQSPALQAFRGVSGFDGAQALQPPSVQVGAPPKEEIGPPPERPGPWPYIELPEWFKVLLGIKQ